MAAPHGSAASESSVDSASHSSHLRFLFSRRAKAAYTGPLAYSPPPGSQSFAFSAAGSPAGCRSVAFQCLSKDYTVQLVERLDQLQSSIACLCATAAPGSPVYALDGEFEAVYSGARHKGGRKRFSQRMALLTLLAPSSSTLFAFHLPSILAGCHSLADQRYHMDAGHEGVRALLGLLEGSKLVTWCGTQSDMPALHFALPALRSVQGHWDLQGEVSRGVKSGRFCPSTPLGLHGAAVHEFNLGLDKHFQLADWGASPSADMLGYAGADVVVTAQLFSRYEQGLLFQSSSAAAGADSSGATDRLD